MPHSTVTESMVDNSTQKEGNFALKERVFAPPPKNSDSYRRRVEVQKFRSAPGPHERPRWNASAKDEKHPFPERAMTNTTSVYNGAEAVGTHFPECIRGTVNLRVPEAASQSEVWQSNLTKSKASQHNSYHCAALDDPEPPLSYLAQKIVEDNSHEKLRLRQQWNASTTQEGFRGNRFTRPDREPDHVQANHAATASMTQHTYVTPMQRSAAISQNVRQAKQLQRDVADETDLTLHVRPEGPKVFKMSNIDAWWSMDPVEVAAQQTAKRQALHENCYSTYRTTTQFPQAASGTALSESSSKDATPVPDDEYRGGTAM